MPLVQALQYEIIFWAKHGVDCLDSGEASQLEEEIKTIMGVAE
jgi:hypothetical protein